MTEARPRLWILGAFVALVLAAGCGVEGGTAPSAMTGEVVRVDASNRSIEVRGANGESGTYYVDASTRIESGSGAIEFSDLAQGNQVAVDAAAKGDRMVAGYVEVVGD